MAKETISLRGDESSITFSNGTILQLPVTSRAVTQFTNDGRRLRSAQLPADIDTSPEFDRAMEELGSINRKRFIST